ncbi:serine hydrolase [Phycisphaeraceae bacterium D3-23]
MTYPLTVLSRLATLTLLTAAFLGCATKPDPYQDRVDALAAPYVEGNYIVGMSVGLLVDGEVYTYHYGTTRAGEDSAPDDRTLYEIGSISKTFTGLLLARGVVEGDWQLDDPVSRYLPGDIELPDGVTLRRLSTHTSGVPRMPADFAPATMDDPYVDYGTEQMHATLRTMEMSYAPGEGAEYSNLAVGLLGTVMAEQRGVSYEQMLRDEVLAPLRMRHTTIALSDRQERHFAAPHSGDGEPAHRWDFEALAGAGAIRSDVRDMLRYAEAQLDPEETPLAEAIALTHRRHTDPEGPSLGQGLGLGWFILDTQGDIITAMGHGGQTGGYACFLGFDRANNFAVVVLTNTSNEYNGQFSHDLRNLLRGEEVEPADLPARPDPIDVPEETLARYIGQYQLAPEMVFTITTDGGKLYAHLTGQPTLRVYPTSPTEFEYRVVEARIVFELPDDDGPATKLTLYQNGAVMESPRIAEDDTE